MDGVAVKPLTVGFHETQFLNKLNQENGFGFWFQLSDKARQQVGSPWGPSNPQSLNRYSYVQNNPLKYTDPSGHSVYTSQAQGREYVQNLQNLAQLFRDATFVGAFTVAMADGAAGIAALLVNYGFASAFIASIAPGLVVAAVLGTALGIPIGLLLGKWAEQLDKFANSVSAIVERSPSGIVVANGCGNGTGSVSDSCGVAVVSLGNRKYLSIPVVSSILAARLPDAVEAS